MPTGRHIDAPITYRAKVTGRHAITLPADLCRRLAIRTGDTVEITLKGDAAILQATETPAEPDAAGLLRGYFTSWDDVNAWLERERAGWDDREQDQQAPLAPDAV